MIEAAVDITSILRRYCLAALTVGMVALSSPVHAEERPSKSDLSQALASCIEAMETRNLDVFSSWSQYSDFRWTAKGMIAGISGNPAPGSLTDRCIITPTALKDVDQIPFRGVVSENTRSAAFKRADGTLTQINAEMRSALVGSGDTLALSCQKRFAFLIRADDASLIVNTLPFRPSDCAGE